MKILRYINRDTQFAATFTAVFSAIIAIGLWRHEMWRDEYHAWGLVLYSNSLSQMLGNLRGEGHLPFSYTVFYFLSRLTANPHAVQWAQFFTATACAYLLLRFAPFKRWQKVLFLLGYFPLYEYGVMSRSYTWDMLGLFGFCAVYGWAKEHGCKPWAAWIFLLIMATNEPFGALMALPLAGLLIRDLGAGRTIKMTTWIWAGSITAACSVLLSYALLRIVPASQWNALFQNRTPHTVESGIKAALRTIKRAVLPDIRLPETIWDFSFIHNHLLSPHGLTDWILTIGIAAILLYLFCRLLLASVRLPLNFWNYPPVFTVWITGFGLLFLFIWFSGGSIDQPRHTGHYYLFFIACWWLSNFFPKRENTHSRWIAPIKNDLLFLLLAQFVFGIFAYALDIVYPFSANQATAAYLRQQHLQNAAMVTEEPIALILNCPAYLPEYDIVSTHFTFHHQQGANATKQQWNQRIWNFTKEHNETDDVVIALKEDIQDLRLKKYFLWRSPPTLVDNEQFIVYRVPRGALNAIPE
jgi:hypothetical protein